jgi:hypothetical protein
MDLQIFETDREKDVGGVWQTIEFRGQSGEFKIARRGNDRFNRIYARLIAEKQFQDDNSDAAIDFREDCVIRAMADAILLDTGDEITNKGQPIKYSPELGYQILKAYPELRNQVALLADDFEQYATLKLETEIKN